jgi:predicted 2-oxoglutarate/Fe(II)-dependent dioxygenase YbiX
MTESAARIGTDAWVPDYSPGSLVATLSPAMCDRFIESAERTGFQRSLVYNEEAVAVDKPDVRGSDTSTLGIEDHREFYAVIADLIKRINSERYRFAINGLDALQVIRYLPGARFKEHTDIGLGGSAHRKISLILQLSDPGDYEGGDLLIANTTVSRARGSGVIFPSWVPHEVHAVTSGLRYSLVTWAVGELFR